jgi:predicted MFS family arabinose efflux permease
MQSKNKTFLRHWLIPFIAVVFAMLCLQMSNLGFSPLLPDIQAQFRLSFSQIGLFTGMYGIIGIIFSVPAGLAARRFGEGRTLLGGLLLVAIGLFCLASSGGFSAALFSRALWLCGYRIAFICVMVAAAITAPQKLKGSTMGIIGGVSALASVIGAPFGSSIGMAFGWRRAFVGYGVMAILGTVAILSLYPIRAKSEHSKPSESSPDHLERSHSSQRNATVWVMAATIGLLNMGGFTMTFFAPAILRFTYHLPPTRTALIISVAYLTAIGANLLCGYIADRTDRLGVMITIALLLIIPAAALNSQNLFVFEICVIALICLGHSATNQGYALIGALHGARGTGPAMGIVSLGSGLYAYAGPQLFGILRDRTGGFHAGFHVLLAAACVSLAALLGLKRKTHALRQPVEPQADLV